MTNVGQINIKMIWSFVESIGIKLVSISIFFWAAKILNSSDLGIIAVNSAIIALGELFIEQGMVSVIVQKQNLKPYHLQTAFLMNTFLGILTFLVLFFTSPLISSLYNVELLHSTLQVSSLIFLVGPPGLVQLALLTKKMRFKTLAKNRIIAVITSAVIALFMLVLGYGLWSIIFFKLLYSVFTTIMYWSSQKWMPNMDISMRGFNDLFSFSSKMLINNIITVVGKNCTELIIGFFLGMGATGIYSLAHKIFQSTIEITNAAINKVMLPLYCINQNDIRKLINLYYRSISQAYHYIIVLLVATLTFIPNVIKLFFDQDWILSADILPLISTSGSIFMICYFNNSIFISKRKLGTLVAFNFLHSTLTLILVAIGSQFSLYSVGYVMILKSIIAVFLSYILLKRIISIDIHKIILLIGAPILKGISLAVLIKLLYFLSQIIFPSFPYLNFLIIQAITWSIGTIIICKSTFNRKLSII